MSEIIIKNVNISCLNRINQLVKNSTDLIKLKGIEQAEDTVKKRIEGEIKRVLELDKG